MNEVKLYNTIQYHLSSNGHHFSLCHLFLRQGGTADLGEPAESNEVVHTGSIAGESGAKSSLCMLDPTKPATL